MAVAAAITTALATCERQPDEGEGVDQNGNKTFTYVLKGPYGDLETCLNALKAGDVVVLGVAASGGSAAKPGWVMSSASLARRPGNLGVLTITCAEDDEESEGGETVQKSLSELWTLRSVRNDMSILSYCGPSDGANASREDIEAWMKEPDGELAKENSYKRPDGTVREIVTDETLAVIGKIRKGVESVMRFYPMLTKTSTYSRPPKKVYEHLAEIDTPQAGTEGVHTRKLVVPGNLAEVIASCEWLKCQDDYVQTGDGKHQRVESWMGLPKAGENDHPWDQNLYGTGNVRWPMPLELN